MEEENVQKKLEDFVSEFERMRRRQKNLTDELTQVNRRGLSLELLDAEKRRHGLGKDSMNGGNGRRYAKDQYQRNLYQVLAADQNKILKNSRTEALQVFKE